MTDKMVEIQTEEPTIEESKVIGKVEIFLHNDGGTSVTGPVNNLLLMMEIFSRAMRTVVIHIAKETNDDIVVPQESPLAPRQSDIIIPK